jgi:predicted hydrocarbon binding protein
MAEIKGEINQEVINTLTNTTKAIIGERTVDNIMRSVMEKSKENATGKDIIFTFVDKIQNLFGQNGGHSIIRQLGKEVAKSLMEKHPKEEWEDLLEKFLNTFGFAYKIERNSNEANICNCAFYEGVLKPRGLGPTEHSVCWYEWGFIEGFVRELETEVNSVEWKERDYENQKCKFVFLR